MAETSTTSRSARAYLSVRVRPGAGYSGRRWSAELQELSAARKDVIASTLRCRMQGHALDPGGVPGPEHAGDPALYLAVSRPASPARPRNRDPDDTTIEEVTDRSVRALSTGEFHPRPARLPDCPPVKPHPCGPGTFPACRFDQAGPDPGRPLHPRCRPVPNGVGDRRTPAPRSRTRAQGPAPARPRPSRASPWQGGRALTRRLRSETRFAPRPRFGLPDARRVRGPRPPSRLAVTLGNQVGRGFFSRWVFLAADLPPAPAMPAAKRRLCGSASTGRSTSCSTATLRIRGSARPPTRRRFENDPLSSRRRAAGRTGSVQDADPLRPVRPRLYPKKTLLIQRRHALYRAGQRAPDLHTAIKRGRRIGFVRRRGSSSPSFRMPREDG